MQLRVTRAPNPCRSQPAAGADSESTTNPRRDNVTTEIAAAVERLNRDRVRAKNEAQERGAQDGRRWALQMADVEQLERLAESTIDDFETNDAHGSPGVFFHIITAEAEHWNRTDINELRVNLGTDERHFYRPAYWEAFVAAALAAWEEIEPQPDAA